MQLVRSSVNSAGAMGLQIGSVVALTRFAAYAQSSNLHWSKQHKAACRRLDQRHCKRIAAAAADQPADHGRQQQEGVLLQLSKALNVFNVSRDPACNRKLVALSVSQMFFSVATYMHDAYLPVYLQDVLGLSNTKIGAAQGVAQMLCQTAKGVAGIAGDLLNCQICVLLFGACITFVCKVMFALLGTVNAWYGVSATVAWFLCTRFLDRMAKGLRDAPAKAVTNELAKRSGDSPQAAYGLRQSLATAGALLGSSIAGLVFVATGQSYEATFVAATLPPAIAVVWLLTQFQDELECLIPEQPPASGLQASKLSWLDKAKLLFGAFKPAYWQAVAVAATIYFTRFDAAFVGLRAKQVMPASHLPLLYLTNSLLQTILTAPLAKLSGSSVRVRNKLLAVGFLAMAAGNWAFSSSLTANMYGMFLGASLLGVHMALSHSTITAMVAHYMPSGYVPGLGKLSGTAVSCTDFLLGFALVSSNMLAGWLSDQTTAAGLGNVGCFFGGGAASLGALLLLMLFAKFGDLGKEVLEK